ncbi:MAG: CvpA family protein [Alphaproteobacteria bacterium]
MYQLNNLDIIILFVIGISALIALSRGLVKEVLSIIGWVLGTIAVIYILPVLTPFAKSYIETGWLAGVVTALFILILFLIVWILFTGKIVGSIRRSKLSGLDRMLGLFFGIARACLLVILFYILISWMIPVDKQSDTLRESKYFQIAGSFAKPIEELIPESTLEIIREKPNRSASKPKRPIERKKPKQRPNNTLKNRTKPMSCLKNLLSRR